MWVAYYRREWLAFLRSAVLLIHHVFGLPWPSTVRGSWFVLRATQLWAPCPDNDPVAARLAMERFYHLLKQHNHEPFDPAEAARLEVEWWHVHREHQHNNHDTDKRALTDALAELYSYAFGVPRTAVRLAAEQRALAMGYSDQWVQAGCDLESSLIAHERVALVRAYAELLAGVPQSSQKREDCLTGDGVRFGAGTERTGKLRHSPCVAERSPAAAALEATSRVSAIMTAGRPPEQATRE